MVGEPDEFADDIFDKKVVIWTNLFWLGFILYISCYVLSTTDVVNHKVTNLFQTIGLILIIPGAANLIKFNIANKFLRVFFIIYCFWLFSLIIRGISFDYSSLKYMFFNPNYGLFMYFIPLILLFPRNAFFFKRAFDIMAVFGILYVIFDMLFIRSLLARFGDYSNSQGVVENFSQHLSLPCGFLLLTSVYHSKKRKILSLIVISLTFLFAVIRARRGLIFMSFSILTFSYIIYQYANKTKVINIIASLFLITLIIFSAVKIYNDHKKDAFSFITARIGAQTRTGVENNFYRDMKTRDWIIGKGMNGQYFSFDYNSQNGSVTVYRKVIETGFLQTILNGGIVSLLLFLVIAIPGVIKGLFFSKNILSKASAIWIILFLLFMYPGTPTAFSFFYMLVWVSIGICYSEGLRNLSDTRIEEVFSKRK